MPADPDAVLARIIAQGDRRRRRRSLLQGSGLAAALLVVGVVVAWPGDGDHQRVDTAADATTTTATTDETGTSSTTTTEAPAGTTEATVPDVTPTTTAPPVSVPDDDGPAPCRNSRDAACGPFYWDTAGLVNQPLQITIDHDAAVAGQPVTFRVTGYDPDAYVYNGRCSSLSSDGTTDITYVNQTPEQGTIANWAWGQCFDQLCPAVAEPTRYGPWDPLPPPATPPKAMTATATLVFPEPGRYTVTAHLESSYCAWRYDDEIFTYYNSDGDRSITVDVAAA